VFPVLPATGALFSATARAPRKTPPPGELPAGFGKTRIIACAPSKSQPSAQILSREFCNELLFFNSLNHLDINP
jgi:hypothetical protein